MTFLLYAAELFILHIEQPLMRETQNSHFPRIHHIISYRFKTVVVVGAVENVECVCSAAGFASLYWKFRCRNAPRIFKNGIVGKCAEVENDL